MTNNNLDCKSVKGRFEKFKSEWLLQVAADKEAKAACAASIVLACRYLNRGVGLAWPSITRLAKEIGASSENTVRSALKLLESRGHAQIKWSAGGKNRTHLIAPLVKGKPFRNLQGMEGAEPCNGLQGGDGLDGSLSEAATLQLCDRKPSKKLKPNHLKEPFEENGAAGAAPYETTCDCSNNGAASAIAGRSSIDHKEASIDQVNLWLEEARIAAYESFLAGFEEEHRFGGRVEGEPEYIRRVPLPERDQYDGLAFDELRAGESLIPSDDAGDAGERECRQLRLLEYCEAHSAEVLDEPDDEHRRASLAAFRATLDGGGSLTSAEEEALEEIHAFIRSQHSALVGWFEGSGSLGRRDTNERAA